MTDAEMNVTTYVYSDRDLMTQHGRLLQDGALTYTWDKNGNRATITYPEAITATYDHDFADRSPTSSFSAS